ncbi:hypothetical protein GDO86_015663 [Hymenochirus boettgeri]|nr:hypothetical protein GDO86_015663 [Hymenochirus boettgeri]
MSTRFLGRKPSEGPPAESQALEIIAHQIQDIHRLELAVAGSHEKEVKLRSIEQEVNDLQQQLKERDLLEQRRKIAEETAARQHEKKLVAELQQHQTEAEVLKSRVQMLEDDLRKRQKQQEQDVAHLQEDLQMCKQEKQVLSDQLNKSQLELASQNSLVQQLRKYIGEMVPDRKIIEEQEREAMELHNNIQALEKERDALKTNLSLLQTRFSSLKNILSLQEYELGKKVGSGDREKFHHLLSRWREKVFCLMVQIKSDEINKENDNRKNTYKISSLESCLQESGQQHILLSHTLQDRTAELEMERLQNSSLKNELSAMKVKSTDLANRVEKAEEAVLNIKQMFENFVQTFTTQEISFKGALSRLVKLGQRISFASKRVDTVQGLVTQRLALLRLSHPEKTKDTVIDDDICRPTYEDLEAEVKLLHKERDRLSAELKRSALLIESRMEETRTKFEAELTENQQAKLLLQHSVNEKERLGREMKEQLIEVQRKMQEACDNAAQLEEQLQKQKREYEKELQSKVKELEDQNMQQLAQMEKHLNEARREHTKAVVALRHTERQMQREKVRNQETLCTLEDGAQIREEELMQKLRKAEMDKNLMTATLRQEGLLSMHQKNRTITAKAPECYISLPGSTCATKESISSILDNLQSLGSTLLQDEESQEEEEG